MKKLDVAELAYAAIMADLEGDKVASDYLWEVARKAQAGDIPAVRIETKEADDPC